jgi:hypothetical protein
MADDIPSMSDYVSASTPFVYNIKRGDAICVSPTGSFRPRVGVAWSTNKQSRHSTFRYISIQDWEDLLYALKYEDDIAGNISWILRTFCRTQINPVDTDLLHPSAKKVYEAIQEELPPRDRRNAIDVDDRSLW